MDQIHIFSDKRLEDHCTYCGEAPSTRDHIPSKILLDLPYPENLPVVPACFNCNNGFSLDEEYFACLMECVICGTVEIDKLQRGKVISLLKQNQSLHHRLRKAKTVIDGKVFFESEQPRIKNVVLKHARGIVKYELSECPLEYPVSLDIKAICDMNNSELGQFYSLSTHELYPEIGSRAFQKIFREGDQNRSSWTIVQDGTFKYSISLFQGNSIEICYT